MADRKTSTNRSKIDSDSYLKCADLVLDLSSRQVTKGDGEPQRLTPKLCNLLATFIRNRGEVLSREFLMQEVWDTEYYGDTRTLEVHVSWLRAAIEDDPSNPRYLHTVRGVGYWFEPNQRSNVEP
ncbi:MAG: winged helix family transcriptional regulator [Chloroflexi bacterium]|nr:MAG: winged helix family transcriptional regulator [Chloroflexota bacterium]